MFLSLNQHSEKFVYLKYTANGDLYALRISEIGCNPVKTTHNFINDLKQNG